MIGGDSHILTLYISHSEFSKFLYCMETDLSSFSYSSKDEIVF